MPNVNKVILVGHIVKDAEIRTVGQSQVAVFSLATSEHYTDRDGQPQKSTEFHDIELWGNAGVYPYLRKGDPLYVEGSIKTDKWTDQNGQQRERKKIRASSVQLLGGKPQQAAPQPAYPPQPQYPPRNYPPQGAPYPPMGQQPAYPPQGRPQTPPMPQAAPQPPMARQLDPRNYDDLPPEFGPMR